MNQNGDAEFSQPFNGGNSTRRVERQLDLPTVPPIVRCKTLLGEAFRYNWLLHTRAFQHHAVIHQLSSSRQRSEIEMLWFQFRCDWQHFMTEVCSEVEAVPIPTPTGDPENDAVEMTDYLQECHNIFYPVVMMELFQKEVTLDHPLHLLALEMSEAARNNYGSNNSNRLSSLTGGKGHWTSLYFQAKMLRERNLVNSDLSAIRLADKQPADIPIEGPEAPSVNHFDDSDEMSSVGGFTENASFTTACSLSPTPVPLASQRALTFSPVPPSTGEVDSSSSPASTASATQTVMGGTSGLKPHHADPMTLSFQGDTSSSSLSSSGGGTSAVSQMTDDADARKVEEVMYNLMQNDAPQAPLDFNQMRYDAETRQSILNGRRSRMTSLLAAFPQGSQFAAVSS